MRVLARVTALAFSLFAAHANAEPLPFQLTSDAPSECPSGTDIQRELERIARPRPGRQLMPLVATATIIRQGGRYRLTLTTDQAGKRRETRLENATCEPLLRAAALVLALAYGDGVERESTANGDTSEGDSPTAPRSDASSTPAHPAISKPRDRAQTLAAVERRALEVAPWISATATSGASAGLAGGAEAGLLVGTSRLLGNLRVAAAPPVDAARRDGVSARLASISSALGACAQVPFAMARIAACARIEAGVLRASSVGARVDGSASSARFAAAPSLLARVPLTQSLALHAELGLLVPFSATRFEVAGEGTLYQTARVIPELGLGFELDL